MSPPPTGGGTALTVSKFCSWALAPTLALPPRSANAPAATATLNLPARSAGGVTSSRYFMSLTLMSTPGVPPLTTTSLAVKLLPTDLLKVNVKVTASVAFAPATLSAMTKVGAAGSTGAAS